ncbi:replication initiator [Streptomyces cremeus]|uniref:Replication initiator n=1 Tax=Streptomyces cremeus TaxID=66881 RepID=A0ABV5P5H0_STRCM
MEKLYPEPPESPPCANQYAEQARKLIPYTTKRDTIRGTATVLARRLRPADPTTAPARCCGTPTPPPCGPASCSICAAPSLPTGAPQRLPSKVVRVSYAKGAEYQKRGRIHFHAVIRLDGSAGPYSPPPAWVTPDLLADAIRLAASVRRLT